LLAGRTDGSSRVMGRASGPSTRRPEAAAPMRRLRSAGAVHGQPTVSGRLGTMELPGVPRLDRSDGRARRRTAAKGRAACGGSP
jgi:hypothetical protein